MNTVTVNGQALPLAPDPPPAEFLDLPPYERAIAALLRETGEVRRAAEKALGPGRLDWTAGGYTWEKT